MNRDNALFALLGLVVGFVAAYPVFEVVSARQPVPRWAAPAGQTAAAPADLAPGAPGESGGGAGAPVMQQVQALRARIEANPNDVEAVCELAQLNLQIQQLDRARPLLEKCQQLQPGDSNTLLALANLYFDTKEWALARDRYQEYLKTDPGNPDVRTDLGVSFLNLGDSKQALQIFEQVQSEHADHWASLYNQVVVLAFHLHDMPAARAALERLRKLAPSGNQDLDRLAAEMDKLGRAAT